MLARYRAEGEAAFEPQSRRPATSPSAISPDTADLIVRLRKELSGQGLDAGPHTIGLHLQQHHRVSVSAATISSPAEIANVRAAHAPSDRIVRLSWHVSSGTRRFHRPRRPLRGAEHDRVGVRQSFPGLQRDVDPGVGRRRGQALGVSLFAAA